MKKTELFIALPLVAIVLAGCGYGIWWALHSIQPLQPAKVVWHHYKFQIGEKVLILDINSHGRIEKRAWNDQGWVVRYFDALNKERFAEFKDDELSQMKAEQE